MFHVLTSTVKCSKRRSSCMTYPDTFFRREDDTLCPLILISPVILTPLTRLARTFISVVFPLPEGPMMARRLADISPDTLDRSFFLLGVSTLSPFHARVNGVRLDSSSSMTFLSSGATSFISVSSCSSFFPCSTNFSVSLSPAMRSVCCGGVCVVTSNFLMPSEKLSSY